MMKYSLLPIFLLAAACADVSPAYKPQRNTINVVEMPNGLVAVAPGCLPFDELTVDRYANDPLPQLGCSTASNLAAQIVNPADLVKGELIPDTVTKANATVGAAAVQRYYEGKAVKPAMTQADTSGN